MATKIATAVRRPHQQRVRTDLDTLLDAAASEFGARGFHATTMADVATRAGTSKPTLYAHFGSKEALHRAALEREAAACRDWLFSRYEAAAPLPMLDELAADIRALFDYVAARPKGYELLFGPDSTATSETVRSRLLDEITDQVAQRLHANNNPGVGQPGRTERQLATTIVGIAFSGVGFAARTGTAFAKACETATAFTVSAIDGLKHVG
jgi:AcrR family transcriptional regulator